MLALPAFAGLSAADLARQIQEANLDPNECYRVLDVPYSRGDLRIFFTSGYLMFTKPVNGLRTGAIFTAEVEGGDAELLLLPALRSERLSLVNFTDSPNLNEHFRSALLILTDNTADDLIAELHSRSAKKVPEMGTLLSERFSSAVRNIASSFQVRLVGDLLDGQRANGLFYMGVTGAKLGNFDMIYDPTAREDILIGQLTEREGQGFFNVWTNFSSHKRAEIPKLSTACTSVGNFRIDATLDPDLLLKATTRMTLKVKEHVSRAIAFSISQQMRITGAKVDGQPAEVFQPESLRSNLIRASGNREFLVITPAELSPGTTHEFEIQHEGQVISKAGDRVFYVGARGVWYPRRGSDFAQFDLTFRYPRDLQVVATGEQVEDRVEDAYRVTRRKTTTPIRFAGFNLGNYKSIVISHDPYRIEVYANKALESSLRTSSSAVIPQQPPWTRRRPENDPGLSHLPLLPQPSARMEALAKDVAGAFEYMAGMFGPPPIKSLTVSPVPGFFGQGFPGLLYLSTLAYMDSADRPSLTKDRSDEEFFSEMLDAHEVAHQWWGNLVYSEGYQDAWLMEALANYTALMFIEKKKGAKPMDAILDNFRMHLLEKGPNGRSFESAGPITWGYRLQSSLSPDSWHHITYQKGAWVIHMLRRRLGDQNFLALLKSLCEHYRYEPLSTEQFRMEAAKFMPAHSEDHDLTSFFENWIYGTGIPTVKLSYAVHGLKVTGTVTQSDVADDFTARIPVEILAGKTRSVTWVLTEGDATPFSIPLRAPAPVKAMLDAKDALIVVKK